MKNRVTVLPVLFSTMLVSACQGNKAPSAFKNSPFAEQFPKNGVYENKDALPLLPLIRGAKENLSIEIYQMTNAAVQSEIISAARRGVEVTVIAESNTADSNCDAFSWKQTGRCEDRGFKARLAEAGVKVTYFDKSLCGRNSSYCFQHGKSVIADNKVALISTGNFSNTSLCVSHSGTCNRDLSVVTDDSDVVRALSMIHKADSRGQQISIQNVIDTVSKGKLTVSPVSRPALVDFIESATQEVQIQNQYLKDPVINEALKKVASRGVDVNVTLSSLCSFGAPSDYTLNSIRPIFSAFEASGIQLKMFTRLNKLNGRPSYMHSKAIVVDKNKGWVGSVNGSTTSTTLNREFGVFIESPEQVRSLYEVLQSDFLSSHNEDWRENVDCVKESQML